MWTCLGNDDNILKDSDAYYEALASQEEIYLEETEEELRMILEFGVVSLAPDPEPCTSLECAREELIAGDSDDPPLSEERIEAMLKSR